MTRREDQLVPTSRIPADLMPAGWEEKPPLAGILLHWKGSPGQHVIINDAMGVSCLGQVQAYVVKMAIEECEIRRRFAHG